MLSLNSLFILLSSGAHRDGMANVSERHILNGNLFRCSKHVFGFMLEFIEFYMPTLRWQIAKRKAIKPSRVEAPKPMFPW